MLFANLTVYISHTIDTGERSCERSGRGRFLRARVMQKDSEDPVYGKDLIPPYSYSSPDLVVSIALKQLAHRAELVTVQFEQGLGKDSVYVDGKFLRYA